MDWLLGLLPFALAGVFFFIVWKLMRSRSGAMRRPGSSFGSAYSSSDRSSERNFADRSEAMFKSMFPDLQPHFHPKSVHEFVKARRARKASTGPYTWKNPPGFSAAAVAEIEPEGLRDKVRLLDAAGTLLAQFIFEEHNEGGVIRLGQGKFTANTREAQPRVRYWHPDREFKWKPNKWTFQSRVADNEIDSSDDRGTNWSRDNDRDNSPSYSSSATRAAAGLAAAGGTFDGGGASAGWDDAPAPGASGDSGSGAGDGASAGASAESSAPAY